MGSNAIAPESSSGCVAIRPLCSSPSGVLIWQKVWPVRINCLRKCSQMSLRAPNVGNPSYRIRSPLHYAPASVGFVDSAGACFTLSTKADLSGSFSCPALPSPVLGLMTHRALRPAWFSSHCVPLFHKAASDRSHDTESGQLLLARALLLHKDCLILVAAIPNPWLLKGQASLAVRAGLYVAARLLFCRESSGLSSDARRAHQTGR